MKRTFKLTNNVFRVSFRLMLFIRILLFPSQFMANSEFVRARTFLRKLEVYLKLYFPFLLLHLCFENEPILLVEICFSVFLRDIRIECSN